MSVMAVASADASAVSVIGLSVVEVSFPMGLFGIVGRPFKLDLMPPLQALDTPLVRFEPRWVPFTGEGCLKVCDLSLGVLLTTT